MMPLLNSLLVVVVLLNFLMLGTSRIRSMIQTAALQGILLGCMPLLAHHDIGVGIVFISIATIAIKGMVIPNMLGRAMREPGHQARGRAARGAGQLHAHRRAGHRSGGHLRARLPLMGQHAGGMLVPAALSTVLTGLIILTTRFKAITQVIGYLVLENGIFIFGLLLIEAMPLLVEMGVLLDLLVGIFVMGIIIGHINREFASVNTNQLSALKE